MSTRYYPPSIKEPPLRRRKPIARRAKHPRKRLKAECDRLFSLYIRKRDGVCQCCGDPLWLQCAHILTRGYARVRYDAQNALALCRRCHKYFTHRPVQWDAWVEMHFGRELLPLLRARALLPGKVDLAAVKLWLEAQ